MTTRDAELLASAVAFLDTVPNRVTFDSHAIDKTGRATLIEGRAPFADCIIATARALGWTESAANTERDRNEALAGFEALRSMSAEQSAAACVRLVERGLITAADATGAAEAFRERDEALRKLAVVHENVARASTTLSDDGDEPAERKLSRVLAAVAGLDHEGAGRYVARMQTERDEARRYRDLARASRNVAVLALLLLCEPLTDAEKRSLSWAAVGGEEGRELMDSTILNKTVAIVSERLTEARAALVGLRQHVEDNGLDCLADVPPRPCGWCIGCRLDAAAAAAPAELAAQVRTEAGRAALLDAADAWSRGPALDDPEPNIETWLRERAEKR